MRVKTTHGTPTPFTLLASVPLRSERSTPFAYVVAHAQSLRAGEQIKYIHQTRSRVDGLGEATL